MLLAYFLSSFLLLHSTCSKQFYDPNSCASNEFSPGSRYICNNSLTSCHTFVVYRARQGFETVSAISMLFGVEQEKVLHANNLTSSSQILEKDREVAIPINCACSGGFFQSNVSYLIPKDATLTKISCEVFEGLVKLHTLVTEHLSNANYLKVGPKLTVPLTCACPDSHNNRDGILYLVTYPFVEKDDTVVVGKRFGISPSDIWVENNLGGPNPTVFPNTTILVPLRARPSINSSIKDPTSEKQRFVPMTSNVITGSSMNQKSLYAIGSGVGIFFMLLALAAFGFYYKARFKLRENKFDSLSTRSSTTSCLSPDLVAEMSKYSLISYSFHELRLATRGFSEDSKLGSSVYKGRLGGGTDVVIKRMGFGDAQRTIGIYSKINHINIVNLEGLCYGGSGFSSSYLVFEFAKNGCLRDCLRNPATVLPWHRRTQIAFDVAIGLHYIHHCTVPSYIHMNITSRSILITEDWRAKIANLGMGSVIYSGRERGDVMMTSEGWIAPEYLRHGSVSDKVDVFAFGVVLLELLSGEEAGDGTLVKKLGFLTGGGRASGCFEELRGFMDPSLKDYPVGEALCMAILAKACVEDDPLPRPSTNDILKILARMVR